MDIQDVRKEMMALWRDTFHDSGEYVNLVFSRYFSPDRIAYEERDGRVVAALLAVPYEFTTGSADGTTLLGWYLCGLATRPEMRRKGIMSALLERINQMAITQGADFTFLIPADGGLAKYYRDRGYLPSFFDFVCRYPEGHDFRKELWSIDENAVGECDDLIFNLRADLDRDEAESYLEFVHRHERSSKRWQLLHSDKDLEAVSIENRLNGLGEFCCFDENGLCRGVAWCVRGDEGELKVQTLYAADLAAKYGLLDYVSRTFRGEPVALVRSAEGDLHTDARLRGDFYVKGRTPEGLVGEQIVPTVYSLPTKSYAMVRLLNFPRIQEALGSARESLAGMDRKECEEILFRKPKIKDELKEMLGLPRIPFAGSLLLE